MSRRIYTRLILAESLGLALSTRHSSPLHAAAELLMAYGADGSARNAEGNTALELAAAAMRPTLGRGPASLAQFCRLLKDFLLPQ
ncbi:unnamed protein product [Boreogadus saida]